MKEIVNILRLVVLMVVLVPSAYALHSAYTVHSVIRDVSKEVEKARAGIYDDDAPVGKRAIPRGYVVARGRVQTAQQTCYLDTRAQLPTGQMSCDSLRSLMLQDMYRGARLISAWTVTVAYQSPNDQVWRIKSTYLNGGAKRAFVPGTDIEIAVSTRNPDHFEVL